MAREWLTPEEMAEEIRDFGIYNKSENITLSESTQLLEEGEQDG